MPDPKQAESFNNDPLSIFVRLLNNDPELQIDQTPPAGNKFNYKTFTKTRKILEKQYSSVYDTIKATQTRIKLNLPPHYIKFTLKIPPNYAFHTKSLKNYAGNFSTQIILTAYNHYRKNLSN